MKDAGSSITLEKIIERHKMPTTYGYSSRNAVDKSLTLGKVEVSVEVYTLILDVYSIVSVGATTSLSIFNVSHSEPKDKCFVIHFVSFSSNMEDGLFLDLRCQ